MKAGPWFDFTTCSGREALRWAIAATCVASVGAITFANEQTRLQNAELTPTKEQPENNPGLIFQAAEVRDHDFVNVTGSPLGEFSTNEHWCRRAVIPRSNRIVVDPLVETNGHNSPSLDQIVADLQGSEPSAIFLRSGVYQLSRPLVITAASGALTIQACPGEIPVIEGPVGEAAIILKNSRLVALIGLVFAGPQKQHIVLDGAEDSLLERNTFLLGDSAITLDHAPRNRIVRNVVRGVASSGIELKDGSNANIVTDNVIDGTHAPETSGGGIFLHGTRDNRIAHNLIQQTTGFGIAVSNWDAATINVGNIIEFNLLRRTVLDSVDSGAIYVLGRSGVDTGMVIASNVIDGFGSPGNHNVGIYLDDSTSGATVVGNIVRAIGSDAIQIHGGQDNIIENNLLDLGAERPSAVLFQAAPADTNPLNRQIGNIVTRNVILSSNPNPQPFVWYDGGTPIISDNFYIWPSGAVVSNQTPIVDQRAQLGTADLLPSSSPPAYGAVQAAAERAIGFKPIDPAVAGIRRSP